jgi:hypothetical protein
MRNIHIKSLLPLSFFIIAPLSEATEIAKDIHLYGRLHVRSVEANKEDFTIENAGHRLGVRGTTTTDAGYDAFFVLETQYGNDRAGITANKSTDSASLIVRHANAGLKTEYGTVTVGRMNNPINATYVADVFETNSGWSEQSPYRIAHTLKIEPNLAGPFDVYAGLISNGEGQSAKNNEEDVDGYMAGFSLKGMDLKLTAGYQKLKYNDTTPTIEDISIGLTYSDNGFYAGLNFEKKSESGDDTDVIDTALTYKINSVTYGAGYATMQSSINGSKDKYRWLVGAYIQLGGNTDTYFEYADYNVAAGNRDNFTWGYRVKF